VDIHIGELPEHDTARQAGVHLYRAPLQFLVLVNPAEKFDLTMILNTWRGWQWMEGLPRDSGLEEQTLWWLRTNSCNSILTVNPEQMAEYKRRNYQLTDIGLGEQKSRMIWLRW
jgi:hypothetical protein